MEQTLALESREPAAVSTMDTAVARQAQEVQAAMIIAQRFPRNEEQAKARILRACQRPALAKAAIYEYPRGGSKVEGPSIRLAEVLAQNWGNLDCGVVELEQKDGESVMMTYAWDLETNFRDTRTFTAKHERSARGRVDKLSDPRDIYEMTANLGARRKRACIMAIIPGDVVDAAVAQCNQTLLIAAGQVPMATRVDNMLAEFRAMKVTKAMIEANLGHNLAAITESEFARLTKVYQAIRDDMGKPEDYFKTTARPSTSAPPTAASPATAPTDDEGKLL